MTTTASDLPTSWPQDLVDLVSLLKGLAPEEADRLSRALALGVTRHRLGPYLANLLRDRQVAERDHHLLAQEGEAGIVAALRQKAETRPAIEALRAAGCTPVLVKGWPLAERLYGSAAIRHSKDIDLHVTEDHLSQAVEALMDLGYLPIAGHAARVPLARAGDRRLTDETNDIAFLAPDGRHVELHWRLTHLHGWVALEAIPEAIIEHPMDGGGTVEILSDRAALIYLSVHGQLHMWGRLKWLLDIAKLLAMQPSEVWLEDLAIANQLGAGRAVRIAVGLAHRVLGAPLPVGWPAPNWLERRAMDHFAHLIASPGGAPGATKARIHYHLCVMAYGEGLTQRLASPRYAIARNLKIWLASRGTA
ncbi:MAG: nucleotidyltransferase family protein [Pseudomonadota bacterium]